MDAKSYVVTCKKCKGSSRIKIVNGQQVLYQDHVPIIACRLRPDMEWGFECQCGNDSRVSPDEAESLPMLVAASAPRVIDTIAKGLTRKNERKFAMELA